MLTFVIVAVCLVLGLFLLIAVLSKKMSAKASIPLFLLLAAVIVLVNSVTIIPTGYTGVKTTLGQVSETPVRSGITLKIPFIQSVELVNNKQQDITFRNKIWSETKERTAIYYENITVTYQLVADKSSWIFANVTDYENNMVTDNLVASSIKAASKNLSDTDATNRSIIEPLSLEMLQATIDKKYGEGVVYINMIVIDNADFDESYNQAIAGKQQALIEAETQAIENQKAIDKAEADAKVAKTKAESKAETELIEAQAESEKNELLEQSITENILKDKWIEKWDGKLPQYMTGDSQGILIGISPDKGE